MSDLVQVHPGGRIESLDVASVIAAITNQDVDGKVSKQLQQLKASLTKADASPESLLLVIEQAIALGVAVQRDVLLNDAVRGQKSVRQRSHEVVNAGRQGRKLAANGIGHNEAARQVEAETGVPFNSVRSEMRRQKNADERDWEWDLADIGEADSLRDVLEL